ncbi:MAG: pyridoxamine 5'-phosphate oxidase [Balneolales bacterium]
MKKPVLKQIAQLRRDYKADGLLEKDLKEHPIDQFDLWFDQALHSDLLDPNAMTLSTADKKGNPSARVVLLKGYDHNGFTFYTNYTSRKSRDMEENPKASIVFFWSELERQVRIEGSVEKSPRDISEEYFHSRPFESQIGAWASHQSSVLKSRDELEKTHEIIASKFKGKKVPLPDFWGGYLLRPQRIEFWKGRPNRLHDRMVYRKVEEDKWTVERLAP